MKITRPYRKTIPIRIYFHICLRGEYRPIVKEMMDEIQSSGLFDACHSINLSIVGTEKEKTELVDWLKNEYHDKSKIHVRYWDESMKSYERPCILLLRKDAEDALVENQPFFSLYIHSKGVTRPKHSQVEHWRKLMTYFLIQQWAHCIRILSEWNAEAVGTIFLDRPRAHFSGNFWWTTDHYVRTLPSQVGNSYEDPEMWIGTCAKFFISLFQHPRPPYDDNLLSSLYENKELGYYTVRDNLYDWEIMSKTPLVFPLLPCSSSFPTDFQMVYGNHKDHKDNGIDLKNSAMKDTTQFPIYTPLIASSYLFSTEITTTEKEKDNYSLFIQYLPTREIIYEIGPHQCFCFVPTYEWKSIISIFLGEEDVTMAIQTIIETRNIPLYKVDLYNELKKSFTDKMKSTIYWRIKYKEEENTLPHDKIFFILYSPKTK